MELNSPSNLIVLLDLNGTLSSVTAKRWLSHRKGIRPGVHHLRRLQVHAPPPPPASDMPAYAKPAVAWLAHVAVYKSTSSLLAF